MAGLSDPRVTNLPDHVVRHLTASDIEAGLALSRQAGWNQTAEDWRFMIAQGGAIGIEEHGRGLVASGLVLPLGPRISWISMVLVAATHRRQGLGTALLRRCIETVQAGGGVPGLDATEQGRPVYLPLGFRDLYSISRWVLAAQPEEIGQPSVELRPVSAGDLEGIRGFDEPRSSMQRSATLHYLQGHGPRSHVAERDGRIAGYALGRAGRKAAQIGPVVAESPAIAINLIKASLARGGPFMLDVPDAQGEVARFLRERGAVRERGYMRMTLGDAPEIAEPGAVYALAGPELG